MSQLRRGILFLLHHKSPIRLLYLQTHHFQSSPASHKDDDTLPWKMMHDLSRKQILEHVRSYLVKKIRIELSNNQTLDKDNNSTKNMS